MPPAPASPQVTVKPDRYAELSSKEVADLLKSDLDCREGMCTAFLEHIVKRIRSFDALGERVKELGHEIKSMEHNSDTTKVLLSAAEQRVKELEGLARRFINGLRFNGKHEVAEAYENDLAALTPQTQQESGSAEPGKRE